MKKVITLILTLSLLLCPLGVSAASPQTVSIPLNIKLMNKGEFPEKPTQLEQNNSISVQRYNSAAGTNEEALQDIHEYVRDCMLKCMTVIPIENYNIVGTEKYISSYSSDLLNSVVNYYAELFHIAGFSGYNGEYTDYSQNEIKLTSINVNYGMTEVDYNTALEFYNNKIDEIISGITPEMSDLEKALYVHDYLVMHFQYDTYYDNYNAYIFFKTGVGVCQAYTQAFNGIMHRLGIECTSAIDTPDKHTWNIITLNGNNYHIDVTHDDPVGQSEGAATHSHFLLSNNRLGVIDKELNSKSDNLHSEWYSLMYNTSCTDDTYESGYAWNDADSSFEYVDGYWYFMAYNAEYTDEYGNKCYSSLYRTKGFKENNLLTTIDTGNSDGSYYTDYNGGITTVGNTLYFTSPKTVYSYKPSTDSSPTIKDADSPNPDIPDISSCRYDGNGVLKVFFSSVPNSFDDGGYTEVTLFKIGDTDGDGKASSTDIANTKKYLLGSKTDFNWATVDFGNKKQVNILDLVKIKKLATTAN